jgi:hypothetical protein
MGETQSYLAADIFKQKRRRSRSRFVFLFPNNRGNAKAKAMRPQKQQAMYQLFCQQAGLIAFTDLCLMQRKNDLGFQ